VDKRNFLEKQLAHYYYWIISDKNRSLTTRSWCITLWVVTVVLLISNQLNVSLFYFGITLILPVLLFWLLDGFQNSFIEINEQQAIKIEQMLTSNQYENIDWQESLLMTRHAQTPFLLKVRSLLVSLFLRETVSFFYLILLIISVVLVISLEN
jgi:hypothetical protein